MSALETAVLANQSDQFVASGYKSAMRDPVHTPVRDRGLDCCVAFLLSVRLRDRYFSQLELRRICGRSLQGNLLACDWFCLLFASKVSILCVDGDGSAERA